MLIIATYILHGWYLVESYEGIYLIHYYVHTV